MRTGWLKPVYMFVYMNWMNILLVPAGETRLNEARYLTVQQLFHEDGGVFQTWHFMDLMQTPKNPPTSPPRLSLQAKGKILNCTGTSEHNPFSNLPHPPTSHPAHPPTQHTNTLLPLPGMCRREGRNVTVITNPVVSVSGTTAATQLTFRLKAHTHTHTSRQMHSQTTNQKHYFRKGGSSAVLIRFLVTFEESSCCGISD